MPASRATRTCGGTVCSTDAPATRRPCRDDGDRGRQRTQRARGGDPPRPGRRRGHRPRSAGPAGRGVPLDRGDPARPAPRRVLRVPPHRRRVALLRLSRPPAARFALAVARGPARAPAGRRPRGDADPGPPARRRHRSTRTTLGGGACSAPSSTASTSWSTTCFARWHTSPATRSPWRGSAAGALLPATVLSRTGFRDEPARALFMGAAAHKFGRLDGPLDSAAGLLLVAAAHAVGWPVAAGGSEAISPRAGVRAARPRRQSPQRGARRSRWTRLRDVAGSASPTWSCWTRRRRAPSGSSATGCRPGSPGRCGATATALPPSRSTSPSRVSPLGQPGRAAGRDGPPRGHRSRDRRRRSGHGARARCRTPAVRAARPAVPRRPLALARRRRIRSTPTPTSRTATPGMRPTRSSARSSGSRRASGTASSPRQSRDPRDSPPTTRTTWAGTSAPARSAPGSWSPGPGWPASRTRSGVEGVYLCSLGHRTGPRGARHGRRSTPPRRPSATAVARVGAPGWRRGGPAPPAGGGY